MSQIKRKPPIVPLAGRVVVNPISLEEKSQGGIILPDFANPSNIQKGVVVAVGRPLPGIPQQLKYMDTILFARNAGKEIEVEGYTYRLMRHNDIIAVL